jgi:hypothetical protein
VKIISSKGQKKSSVNLTMNYGTIANLKFDKFEENKKFNVASTPYRFSIENNGKEGSLFDIINFGVLG